MRKPNARYTNVLAALKQQRRPSDRFEAELYDVMSSGQSHDSAVRDAYDIYNVIEHRTALDAFCIVDASPQVIQSVLQVPASVVEAYRHLFFDTSAFRNRLERFSYAREYPADLYGKELMRSAVTAGLDYLMWAYGAGDTQVDSRAVIRQTMAEAYYRGMAHRGQSIGSVNAKEAHKWWSTAVRNAELLEKVDPRAEKQALEEIRIALDKYDDTLTATSSPVPVNEILH